MTTAAARTASRAARLRYQVMARHALAEPDLDHAYDLLLDLEDELLDLLTLVREDLAITAIGLTEEGPEEGRSQRQIALRHKISPGKVQGHIEAARGIRARDDEAAVV